ncbi:FadR/GntR family transcriptional regulator [Nesterenkonia halobia]|uniref:FadR/GntR family transcriptional regulator n=1 Tax=Nesterenkonia halobia TaxID=37922 RepID=A0ABP6RDX4_9MICC
MPRYPQNPAEELHGRLSTIPASTPTAAVASRLLAYFTSGEQEPGTRLPAERQLAEMLGTGRSAVREALAALEILGIVEVRPGSGTYLQSHASELLPRTLNWGLMLGAQNVADLVELRSTLEAQAARHAAERRDDDAVDRLQRHVDTMTRHQDLGDRQQFIEADAHFHQELAACTGNAALSALLQSVRALLRIWVDRGVARPEDAERAITEHAAIIEAVRVGDPEAAAAAMGSHMGTAQDRVLTAVEDHSGADGAAAESTADGAEDAAD